MLLCWRIAFEIISFLTPERGRIRLGQVVLVQEVVLVHQVDLVVAHVSVAPDRVHLGLVVLVLFGSPVHPLGEGQQPGGALLVGGHAAGDPDHGEVRVLVKAQLGPGLLGLVGS